eukprot:3577508-Heterocapsa_arctica.AAC.1
MLAAWSLIDDLTISWARRLQASVSDVVASKLSCTLAISSSSTCRDAGAPDDEADSPALFCSREKLHQ